MFKIKYASKKYFITNIVLLINYKIMFGIKFN